MPTRPCYFALYLLGTEIFAIKLGRVELDVPKLEAGSGGSHDFGFVGRDDEVYVVDKITE